jgi:spermidine/putrescine-binding protein
MKKLWMGLLVLILLSACASTPTQTLKVYNWGEYIDQATIREFEQRYNVRVIYDTYDSNELMYTKLLSGEVYDILVPTDHMVERLIAEGRLQALDLTAIPNASNLIEGMLNQVFDPNNVYSLPYFWGNIGFIYNTETVTLQELEAQGWNLLHNPAYKNRVYIYDSARDGFMVAMKALGLSVNTSDEAEIEAAYQWLITMDQTVAPVYIAEEIIDAMINAQKDIAVDFSGDGAYVSTENPAMGFYVPLQGTNVWMDSMVIPANAANVELAHAWINFMLEVRIATLNTEYVGYTSPVREAFAAMTAPEGLYYNNQAYQPRVGYPLDEVYRYNDALRDRLNELWTRLKAR